MALEFAKRQQALAHIGVVQWYARKRLSGAATSPDWQELGFSSSAEPAKPAKEVLGEKAPISSPEPSVPASAQPPSAAVSKRENASSVVTIQKTEESKSSTPQLLEELKPALSIKAYLFEGVLVTSEVTRDHPDAEERILASNILFACSGKRSTPIEVYGFEWPVFERRSLQRALGVDRDQLLRRWVDELHTKPFVWHWHFGSESNELFNQKPRVQRFSWPQTLRDIIANPASKGRLWSTLQEQNLPHQMRTQ